MKSSIAALLLTLTVLAPTLVAGPLNQAEVPAEAKWVAHLDVEAWFDSGLGGFLLDQINPLQLDARLKKFSDVFGFDPLIDLKSVTVFGTEQGPAEAVALVRAKVEKERLLTLLQANAGHEVLLENGRTVHRWVQKPEGRADDGVRYGTFYADDATLISRSKKALLDAVAVLDGKAASLATQKENDLLPQMPKGTILVAGARDIEVTETTPPQLAMLKSATLVLGENEGVLFGRMVATMREEIDGQRVRHLLQGMQALAQLRLERDKRAAAFPELKTLLKGFSLSGEGPVVQVDFSAALEDVKAMVLRGIALRKERAAARQARE